MVVNIFFLGGGVEHFCFTLFHFILPHYGDTKYTDSYENILYQNIWQHSSVEICKHWLLTFFRVISDIFEQNYEHFWEKLRRIWKQIRDVFENKKNKSVLRVILYFL